MKIAQKKGQKCSNHHSLGYKMNIIYSLVSSRASVGLEKVYFRRFSSLGDFDEKRKRKTDDLLVLADLSGFSWSPNVANYCTWMNLVHGRSASLLACPEQLKSASKAI